MEATLRQNLVWPNLRKGEEAAVKKKLARRLEINMVNYQRNWQTDLCHSMATTSMKYCLIDVVIYITTI
jgi:hypothetical protein